ncbi:hypothetical protein CDL15_Pgr001695 [Punica granatum]|uniref:Suppressor of RPS4-RLD 1 n=1 Tax=Punica granatum TaxID=22663 RepID=A0A218XC76_PUNGR|nr:hypothetical protein CDL15_Pgr001695 [Punica granatum]
MGSPAVSERVELANFCRLRDWSKAIRVLDALLAHSSSIQDICNRAFCYSQLELHKHVVKDCDRALQLDPTLLQAHILKGRALSALGRKVDAVLAWKKGYEHALSQSADLKLLLELEELLSSAKQDQINGFEKDVESMPSLSPPELISQVDDESSKSQSNEHNLSDKLKSYSKSNGTSDESNHNLETCNGFTDEGRVSEKHNSSRNGNLGVIDTVSNDAISGELSLSCSGSSSSSSDVTDVSSKSVEKSVTQSDIVDKAKKNKKFCVTRISKNRSISVDFRLSRGIAEVNEGKYAHAVSIFDQILREDPTYPEALIGRGTAYAFQRELDAAISDFSKAIQANPSAGEAWKRRGQARAALGSSAEAITDLTRALEFEPNSGDILHERGIINFKFKDFDAAVEDLSTCIQLDKDNKSAYTYLGLALSSIGEYRRAEEAHMKAIQLDQNFLEAWAHLTQFYHELAKPLKSLECIQRILHVDKMKAIKELSTGLSIESSNIECLYLRGSCYHAVGDYVAAVKDYDAALDLELDSMEKFVLQCLAFYQTVLSVYPLLQKEIALYTASKGNTEFCWFDLDGDIDPLFKEYWCKRLHPKNVCEKVYRQPPLRDSMRKGKLKKQDFVVTKQKAALLLAADSIGKKIQYDCPGFLPNRRQHRMAGLAAIEIAQKVSKVWRSLQAEWRNAKKGTLKSGKRARRRDRINLPSQNRGGAGCSTSSSSETSASYIIAEDRLSGRGRISWQDIYSVAVKWRQISEPCDPVVWVNKLSEEFNAGFGSHTPMILGQAKVVRYYPNYERTLDVAKTIIKEKAYVRSKTDGIIDLSKDGKLEEIMNAKSCSDLYKAVGEDFWLATGCNSTALEGEHGYDFAIRTPCTPARWEDFDEEMQAAWENLCNTFCGENYGSTDFGVLEKMRDAILRITYYWYNFMPLSRGTAAVGFVVLLGLLLAANMEFTGSIPKGLQVDWEAILNFHPNSFTDSVKSWLYPSLNVSTSWKEYPDVMSTLSTTASVVAALSHCDDQTA